MPGAFGPWLPAMRGAFAGRQSLHPPCGRSARAWPCHARHPGLLSRVEKVGKDTPGTSWFGVRRTPDLRHKGADPLGFPGLCPSGIGCGNLNPQASSGSSLPRHGLKTQSVTSVKLGEKKDRFAHLLKVANRSIFVAENPIEGVAACRRGSEASPSGGPGVLPWRAFGDFPRDGKVTRGGGAERPPGGGRSQV